MNLDPLCCMQMGGTPIPFGPGLCLGDGDGNGTDDACEDEPQDTCDFYKAPWEDYAPFGMPDFDQKQDAWTGLTGTWSHCGPVALANCFWWFDSKFEPTPVDPRPPRSRSP